MADGPILETYWARINPDWRLHLVQIGTKWELRLVQRGTMGDGTVVGEWGNEDEAKVQGEMKAREMLEPLGVPVGRVDWQKQPSNDSWMWALKERERAAQVSIKWQGILGFIVGLIGVVAAISISLPKPGLFSESRTNDIEIATLKTRAAAQDAELAALRAAMAKGTPATEVPQAVATLQNDVTSLRSKMADYEAAVGDEPAKRLAVPLLRKDMDTLREEHKNDLSAIHEEVSRTFDTMKWLLGLLGFTNLVSLVPGWLGRKSKEA